MAAGGSDYSGVAQGGIGQGFAQGSQQGIDNYNKAVDRKATQANTYLTQFIGPQLQKLSVGLQRPPAGASQQEIDAWVKAETARRLQVSTLLKQSETYLKATGSPITPEEWSGLFYDPNSALSADDWGKLTKSYGSYGAVDKNINILRQQLLAIDPVDSPEAYAKKLEEYNKYKESTGYEQLWTDVNGAEYKEFIGGEAEVSARRKDAANKLDTSFLASSYSAIQDADTKGLIGNLIATNTPLSATDPKTGKTYRQVITDAIDKQGLEGLINSGTPEGVNTALQRIGNMTDEQRAANPAATQLWNDYQNYLKDPTTVQESFRKTVFQSYTAATQKIKGGDLANRGQELSNAAGENNLTIQGLDINLKKQEFDRVKLSMKLTEFQLSEAQRDSIWKFGTVAAEGNQMVRAGKSQFMASLPADMPQEEKDKLWETAVEQPLRDFAKSQALNIQTVESNLVSMRQNQVQSATNALEKSITDGTLHLTSLYTTDANGNVVINKDGAVYKNLIAVQGEQPDETYMGWYNESQRNFKNKDAQTQQNLQLGADTHRINVLQEQQLTTVNRWAEKFNQQKWEQGKNELAISTIEAEIAPAKAAGELGLMVGKLVEINGPGILDDPKFKEMFAGSMGGEQGYESAANFLRGQAKYEAAVKANTLTIQGQQITEVNNTRFDRMFTSPEAIRSYMNQPDKVREIAMAAGVNPDAAMSMLTQLSRENKALSDLQMKQIRFDMYARQQNIDLSIRGANLAERSQVFTEKQAGIDNAYREKRSKIEDDKWLIGQQRGVYEYDTTHAEQVRQFGLSFNYQIERDTINDGFRIYDQNFEWQKWDDMKTFRNEQANIDIIRDARDFAEQQRVSNASIATQNRQVNSAYIGPLTQKLDVVQGQLDTANADFNNVAAASNLAAYIAGGLKWVQDPDSKIWSAEQKNRNPNSNASYNELVKNGTLDQLTLAYNRKMNLEAEQNAGKLLFDEVINVFQKQMNGFSPIEYGGTNGTTPGGTSTVPLGSAKPGKIDFKTYQTQAPTKEGAAIASFVSSAISGALNKAYPNIQDPKYCTTFVQAMMGTVMNVPGGVPTAGAGGAMSFETKLLAQGAQRLPGSGAQGKLTVKDLKNLPDGTLLFQHDGTTQGHVAMVLGGMVVQNSTYPNDNKIAGAIGTMSLESFVNSATTYGVQVPPSWYKGGTGPRAGAVAPATTGGRTTTTPVTGGGSTTPAATKKVKYGDSEGNFVPDLPSVTSYVGAFTGPGRGVRMTSSPGGNAGLTFNVGSGRYAVISSETVAMRTMDRMGAQFGVYMAQSTGTALGTAVKKNPAAIKNALTEELKLAGFSGDLNGYIDKWFKSKGWTK